MAGQETCPTSRGHRREGNGDRLRGGDRRSRGHRARHRHYRGLAPGPAERLTTVPGPGARRFRAFFLGQPSMTRIFIYDTTLRDGSQGEGVNFSLTDKLHITRRLDEMGVDYVEGGYPLSNPKDAEYFAEVRTLPLRHAKLC